MSPHNPKVVYQASHVLHRTQDDGVTWQVISPDLTAHEPEYQIVPGNPITRDVTGEEVYSSIYSMAESPIDRCKLAHAVYNTFDYAEFVCKQPTPLVRDGAEVAWIYHYSDYHRLAVTHTLFAVGSLG